MCHQQTHWLVRRMAMSSKGERAKDDVKCYPNAVLVVSLSALDIVNRMSIFYESIYKWYSIFHYSLLLNYSLHSRLFTADLTEYNQPSPSYSCQDLAQEDSSISRGEIRFYASNLQHL
jgi:hypothetical protein